MSVYPPTKPEKQPDYVPPFMEPPNRGNSWLAGCLIGCSITFVLFAILATLGIYLAVTRGPNLLADAARENINQLVDEIPELPDDEKQIIKEQIDRVVDAFKKREIDLENLSRVFEDIGESPLIGSVILIVIKSKYLNSSGLSDEEKEQAARTVQRVWRGVVEKKIKENHLESAVEYIARKKTNTKNDPGWELREQVTDDELRQFFQELNQVADRKEIPDEDYDVNIGKEIKRIVDRLLDQSD